MKFPSDLWMAVYLQGLGARRTSGILHDDACVNAARDADDAVVMAGGLGVFGHEFDTKLEARVKARTRRLEGPYR